MASEKSRYWSCVMYNENMIDNWEEKAEEILQLPVSYCVHDEDKNEDGTPKKTHTHFLMAYTNTTTKNCVKGLFDKLQAEGKNAYTPQGVTVCRNVRNEYDYQLHDTAAAKKKGKHLYKFEKRILLNNFNIDDYYSLSCGNERRIKLAILELIVEQNIENLVDLYKYICSSCDDSYLDVFCSYSGLFERMIKGVHYKNKGM